MLYLEETIIVGLCKYVKLIISLSLNHPFIIYTSKISVTTRVEKITAPTQPRNENSFEVKERK
jgi:hypothetical protein